MEDSPKEANPQESQTPKLTRRDALKVLVAATGAAMLSFVPNKWSTPVIDVGMLPAHAQGLSGTGTIVVNAIHLTPGAPVRAPQAPNPSACDLNSNLAYVTVPSLVLAHCFALNGGTVTWPNIQPGNYQVFWNSFFCVFNTTSPQTAHVVSGGTATINLHFINCTT